MKAFKHISLNSSRDMFVAITLRMKRLWVSKAARRYCDFICKIKKERDLVQPDFVPENVWDNWMKL